MWGRIVVVVEAYNSFKAWLFLQSNCVR